MMFVIAFLVIFAPPQTVGLNDKYILKDSASTALATVKSTTIGSPWVVAPRRSAEDGTQAEIGLCCHEFYVWNRAQLPTQEAVSLHLKVIVVLGDDNQLNPVRDFRLLGPDH